MRNKRMIQLRERKNGYNLVRYIARYIVTGKDGLETVRHNRQWIPVERQADTGAPYIQI